MELHGSITAAGYRFAIIVSRFNEEITEGLLTGARAALESAQVRADDITLDQGAWRLRDSRRGSTSRRDGTLRRDHLSRAA